MFFLHSFVLDVPSSFAGTRTTLSNILLVVLCTIWHEKVNGGGFHSKESNKKPQLYL